MYHSNLRNMLGLLLTALLVTACDSGQPETAPADAPLDTPAPSDTDVSESLDCSWSDAVEATEDLTWTPESLDDDQVVIAGLPQWAVAEDIASSFPTEDWTVELIWHDGAEYTMLFSLEEIRNFRYIPIEGNSEDVLLVDGLVQISIPEANLTVTREVTIFSRYSEFVWSMGGLITVPLTEQAHCEQALWYHTRYSFQGPTEGVLTSEDHETGLQALLASQPL